MKKHTNQLALFSDLEKPLELPVERVGVYAQIAEVTDEATADKFAELVAGLAVYIPARVEEGNWIAEAVGLENAKAICDLLADGFGLTMDFPLGQHSERARRRLEIIDLINQGEMSHNEIAASVGCTRFTVGRIKKELVKITKKMK
jgi:hypothetical protein